MSSILTPRSAYSRKPENTVVGPDDAAMLDQLGHDRPDAIHRNRKPNARVLTGAGGDGDIHADHACVGVEQRTARVAGIHRGIGLNERLHLATSAAFDGTIQARNNPFGQRPLEPERVAERVDLLSDAQTFRLAQGERHQQVARRVDLEHGDIVFTILAYQFRRKRLAGCQSHFNGACVSITWALVRMCPCLSITDPEPDPAPVIRRMKNGSTCSVWVSMFTTLRLASS